MYLKYRLFDVDLIFISLGCLNLWLDSRWENFGLRLKNFRLIFDDFLNEHLVSYYCWILLLLVFLGSPKSLRGYIYRKLLFFFDWVITEKRLLNNNLLRE